MNRAATIALSPFSLLYGAAMKARAALYDRGIFHVQNVSVPVISIGNLTTGGTGKTPLVEWVANRLADAGHRVGVLTRGYGRTNPHQRVVVSDGSQILSDVESAGDEPLMLAESLLGKAAIICDMDRAAAAKWAIENLECDVLILDDGFQHLGLARDLDIVTIDATRPFANGWVLPAGMLREPISSLARAHCVVITRANGDDDGQLVQEIKKTTDAPILRSRTFISRVRLLNVESPVDMGKLRLTPVGAFCGLGNPDAFFQQLRADQMNVVHPVAFRDHQRYSQSDIDQLTDGSVVHGAEALITTTKDEVKLRSFCFRLPCYVVEIEIQIDEPQKLIEMLERAIKKTRA